MNSEHPQEALLLAYVDGQLDGADRARAQQLVENDSSAREFVALLERSKLSYKAAFDERLDATVPEAIEGTIRHWTPPGDEPVPVKRPAQRFALVATLLLGIAVGFGVSNRTQRDAPTDSTPAWLAQVASYHELYVRDTVDGIALDADRRQQLAAELTTALGAPLQIPDLRRQKLDFKRGQLLQIEGRALIQLAYLPDAGTPVALCITKNGAPDAGFASGESHNLRYVN